MKNVKSILAMSLIAVIGFTSCEKSDLLSKKDSIEGTYVGTITVENSLKSGINNLTSDSYDATAEVKDLGNGQAEVHCYGGEMDTTFMLNYYENYDSVMVCLNGEDFENTYGHTMGQGGMMGNGNSSGGMMGGNNSGQTGWMSHMNNEHNNGDEHFGGFDMTNHSFDYTMQNNIADYRFQGTKR
ncbi:MAG: hypothetical protein GXO79_15090 [Chlorobi bacterium]|nr:hypothetical protein [Chlorobiota bacterium]